MRNNHLRKISLIAVVLVGLLAISGGQALAEELTGREIMDRVYNRDEGEDRTSNLEMILINKRDERRVREIKQFEKDFGDVEKKIMFFISPRDVKDTSFMNWSYDDERSDDQWIYLPALRKVKRISSENKSDYFMGSDFTYDDLGERHLDQDEHELLRAETLDGEDCYVVESIPVEDDYMYSRTVTWVIKDKWLGLKKEFYDPEGDHLKTLRVKNYEEIEGILTVLESEMHNVQKDHRTVLKTSEVDYNTGLEDIFTERMMRRGLR